MAIGWKITKPVSTDSKISSGYAKLTAPSDQPRAVYRYSVIPGGVLSAEELAVRLNSDPVAARHYSGFRVTKAVLVSNTFAGERAYVSYRVGERILWTKKQVHIDKAEALLTDGRTFARSRCGNQISEKPQEPTAETDPVEEALLYIPPPVEKQVIRLPEELEIAPSLPSSAVYKLPAVNTLPMTDEIVKRVGFLSSPGNVRKINNLNSLGEIPEPASSFLAASGTAFLAFAICRTRRQRQTCRKYAAEN